MTLTSTLLHFGFAETLLLVALRCLIRVVVRTVCPTAWYDMAEGIFIAVFFSYLCWHLTLALVPDFYAPGATEFRCLHVSEELLYCTQLYFASNIADMPFLIGDALVKLRPKKDVVIMTLHHVLSAACFWGALYTDKMYFFATYALVCEYTTVLVGVRRVMLPFKASPRVSSAISLLDCVIMAAYCRFRLFLFAKWFYYSWTDGSCLRYSSGPAESVRQLAYNPVILFLLCISVWWLRTMLTKSGARLVRQASRPEERRAPTSPTDSPRDGKSPSSSVSTTSGSDSSDEGEKSTRTCVTPPRSIAQRRTGQLVQ